MATETKTAVPVDAAKVRAEIDALITRNTEYRKQIKENKARILDLKKLAGRKKMSPEQKEAAKKERLVAKYQAKLAELQTGTPVVEPDKVEAQTVAPADKVVDDLNLEL